jgi:hypothetical protein
MNFNFRVLKVPFSLSLSFGSYLIFNFDARDSEPYYFAAHKRERACVARSTTLCCSVSIRHMYENYRHGSIIMITQSFGGESQTSPEMDRNAMRCCVFCVSMKRGN